MTEETFHELDARARRAATAVLDAVADEPIPTFDPERVPGSGTVVVRPLAIDSDANGSADGRRGRPRWVPLASIAAALLLIVGVAVALMSRTGEDSAPADDVRMEEPEGFEATYLPDGLTLSGVTVGRAGSVPPTQMASTFGPSPDETDLLVAAGESEYVTSPANGGDPVEIGDWTAWPQTDAQGRSSVYVETGPGRFVILASRTLEPEPLLTAARGLLLDVHGAPGIEPTALPPGWNRLATLPSNIAFDGPAGGAARDGSVVVGYADNEASRSLSIETGPGVEGDLYAPQVQMGTLRSTTVRGNRALVGVLEEDAPTQPAASVLTWFEEPGRLVRITAQGVDEAELKQVAEGLEQLAGDQLAELTARTADADFDAENRNTTLVARGTTPEGAEWVVRAGNDGEGVDRDITVKVTQPNGDSAATTGRGQDGGDTPFAALGNERVQSTRIVYGLVDSSVVSLRASYDESADVDIAPLSGAGGFALEVPLADDVRLEALDSDGNVVGETTAGADDVSTTGGASTTIPD